MVVKSFSCSHFSHHSQEKFYAFKISCDWIGSAQKNPSKFPHLKGCNLNHDCKVPFVLSGNFHRFSGVGEGPGHYSEYKSIC